MNYRIEEKAAFRIVGFREPITSDAEEMFKLVPLFWQKTAPRIPQVLSLMNGEPKGLLGVSTCNEVEGKQNYYYIAVSSDMPAPDVEVYLNDDVQNMQFEVWLPVVKK